eukprot:570458-Pleurochrysis_carterae.AAC.1
MPSAHSTPAAAPALPLAHAVAVAVAIAVAVPHALALLAPALAFVFALSLSLSLSLPHSRSLTHDSTSCAQRTFGPLVGRRQVDCKFAVLSAHEHTPSHREIAVKPGVPARWGRVERAISLFVLPFAFDTSSSTQRAPEPSAVANDAEHHVPLLHPIAREQQDNVENVAFARI